MNKIFFTVVSLVVFLALDVCHAEDMMCVDHSCPDCFKAFWINGKCQCKYHKPSCRDPHLRRRRRTYEQILVSYHRDHLLQSDEEIISRCSGLVDFNLYAVATNHIYLAAIPSANNQQYPSTHSTPEECFPVIFNRGGYGKEAFDYSRSTLNGCVEELPLEDGYFLGTFKLERIFDAFDMLEDGGEYDLIHNNCAGFILDMMELLGIPLNDALTQYVVEKIYQYHGTANALRAHPRVTDILPRSDIDRTTKTVMDYSDYDLISLLVSNYLNEYNEKKNGV
ncbi:hypothetical protein ACA910_019806 [Epithemia clementina (nom. ined.)]